ncbi:MAG: hypothetical protein ACOWYE_05885 [Desulfatiglandales bacterium]
MNVFILTFCRNLELFYGSALIFKTLRVGFPNAKVCVTDNASLPDAQARIAALSRENDCEFKTIKGAGVEHHVFIEATLRTQAAASSSQWPMVILDPDICLWQSWEGFCFDGLMAGKRMSLFDDPITDTLTMPRIHSSLLWISNPKVLWHEILRIKAKRFDFLPFQPFSFRMNGKWYRYDTGAGLYATLPGKCSFFSKAHFDSYDHLYAGSHLDWLVDSYDYECREMIIRTHNWAKTGDLEALKGIWREQDRLFQKNFPHSTDTQERSFSDEKQIRTRQRETSIRGAQGHGIL